jgi:Spy/CpxP family protein refolding chaperone
MLRNWILALTLGGLAYASTPAAIAQDAPSSDQQAAPAGAPSEHEHGRGPGRFDPDRRAEMLAKKLNLNADQKTKVTDIFKSEQSEMQKMHADASASQGDRRSKMMDVHKSSNDQVRALLDADQQKKFDEMMAKREQWGKGRHEGPPAAAPDSDQK